jgi:ERCC4-type nuclease
MARKQNKKPLLAETVPVPLPSPFIVQVDTREQQPFAFLGLVADVREGSRPLDVRTHVAALPSGDYSVLGHETDVAVERKSLQDLYATLSQGRERFERELERLSSAMFYACVVVEAEWSEILNHPPEFCELLPKSVFRSVLAWQQRYANVHWLMMPNRDLAEAVTYRVLERYWRDHVKEVEG